MIVVTLGLIGYRLYFHTTVPTPAQQHENAMAPATVPGAPAEIVDYRQIPLDQPPGSAIARTAAEGNRVYVTVTGGGEPDRVIVVDLARGRAISTIGLGNADTLPPRPGR